MFVGMARGYTTTPELLDPDIDKGHRSYLLTVERRSLDVLRCRPPAEFLHLDQRWLGR